MKVTHVFAFPVLSLVATLGAAEFEIVNQAEFHKVVPATAQVEKVASDMGFLEGPVWVPANGGYLVFSDIPNNELKKWTQADGVTTFRKPSNNCNGNTLDREGRLVGAEHSGRRISLTQKDGAVEPLVERYEGKRFNSPNDVVVKSDSSIWFTDPDHGLKNKTEREQAGNFVFRFAPATKKVTLVVQDFDKPNGLCFSPDETRLYIADSGAPRHIRVFQVEKDGTLKNGTVFCSINKGAPDGIRCDADGRIWSSSAEGVQIFAPNGELVGKILVPESPANLCFGGADGKTLFITARKSLYKLQTKVAGAGVKK